MKKLTVVVTLIIFTLLGLYAKAVEFFDEEFMSTEEVCQRWGEQPFDIMKFKSAVDELVRAKMTCSLLRNQEEYIGLDRGDIENLFGSYTGYFFSESIPAYLIEIAKTKEQDSWQIVFFTNRKKKVSTIVVHKNCCNRLDIEYPEE